ncbi:protein phosphatase 1 regulatory subunit 42 isoform X2 [Hippocampus comes]|uniref:Protein phosphatase 1, regulatory subunit 42 n=1 Tax=Hippocampus comes TaxID=109280 RepID=A0A3Q3DVB2_HIPCM|nr:PREDICTED: protein phosphatase 1 regulatory subunit 42 isoform X1 [Hippocampus comes]XP_019721847.1 PREDICTED: protein phosphatase 1 regulatory subunit 42 isoform X2 [Hippocampus comes]XP_019721848.1 PREDICTED: protein phosphatase 1 regulatory subunit 42 isoform X2 [Hippocampus comes]XP_019721849.1 PREDICTED: protein phosphatase 1 regulatory subunit 42 isoform X2 [Hippocampus comes]XP_019721850.1 PREDICTED: protein phosphatase 1 regulatory subunit 42 isoform X2 [Hippocampus comes]
MVTLTTELIVNSRNFKKKKGRLSLQYNLRTLTHLHFSGHNIEDIGDLSACQNLTVLYLYNNCITQIQNLDFACNLTHLYLQNNNITHIDNLAHLHKLSKLFLGGNRISLLEGLESLGELEELHMESQRLPPGEKLLFDPRTLRALAKSLRVLNISNNNIDEMADLAALWEIRHFSAADNKLRNVEELESVSGSWPWLVQMDLRGNPVCKTAKYRDRLITACKALEVLDGRDIHEVTREFLVKWEASKEAKKKKKAALLNPPPLMNNASKGQGAYPPRACCLARAQGWKLPPPPPPQQQQQSHRVQLLKSSLYRRLNRMAVTADANKKITR